MSSQTKEKICYHRICLRWGVDSLAFKVKVRVFCSDWGPFFPIFEANIKGKMSSYVSTEYDYVTGVNRKKQWQLVIVVDSLIQRQIKQSDHMSACISM